MSVTTLHFFLTAAACLCVVGLIYGILVSRQNCSPIKSKQQFQAHVCLGLGIVLGACTSGWFESHLPSLSAEGTIQTVQVSGEKVRQTSMRIHLTDGSFLSVYASGDDHYFQPGQHLRLTYKIRNFRGFSGSIQEAHFISSNGIEEGTFTTFDPIMSYFLAGFGLFVIWGGYKKYKRDPEATETDRSWSQF